MIPKAKYSSLTLILDTESSIGISFLSLVKASSSKTLFKTFPFPSFLNFSIPLL